jgi:tRNA 2-thiouridine synthesizing protein D
VASITVIIGDPPYGKQRAYTALRFVQAASFEKHSVNLFLLEDAVFLAKKGQEPKEMPSLLEHAAMPNCEELLKAAVKQGAKVGICGVCCSERALKQEELVEGCKISSMKNLVKWVVESDKVMFF